MTDAPRHGNIPHDPPPVLSILGFGAFGRFITPHLAPHFRVQVFDRRDITADASALGVRVATPEEAAHADVVVLAVPVQHMPALLADLAPRLRPGTLVLDVASVKLRPAQLLAPLGPACHTIGTHPLFGPQSGKDGIRGLPVVLCPLSAPPDRVACVRDFLSRTLGLHVLDATPDEHDRQMAYVQALTHLLSRALEHMNLPEGPMVTAAYQRLLAMRANLREDSLDLFLTIERENPYAAAVRRRLCEVLDELEQQIHTDRPPHAAHP